MEYAELANEVSKKSNIKVSKKDIERLVGALQKTGDPWVLADISDFPVPAVFETLNALKDRGLVSVSDSSVTLTENGLLAVESVHPVEDFSCGGCEGRGISLEHFVDIRDRFNEIQRSRPAASHDFDQGYVTPSSTFSRFLIGYERGDIEGRDILLHGDADLLSIVLGLSRLQEGLTVVEVDKKIVGFIEEVAGAEGLEVSVREFDLRKPLPPEHVGAYDTFYTDPPETLPAVDAFVGRGIASLRSPGSAGYFGFTRREASLEKWWGLQRLLLGYKVVITDIIHNFNEYINWGYERDTRAWRLAPVKVEPRVNWYRSALYRIEALPGFCGNAKDYGEENIYEDAESSTT